MRIGPNFQKVGLAFTVSRCRCSKKDRSKLADEQKKARSEERRKRRAELVSKIRSQIAKGETVSVLDSGDPLVYGPMAWYLEEFKDLHPVVIPGVSCFNAANVALRKSITSGTETRSVVLTSRRDIEKMSAHHPTMVIFTTGTEFNDLITRLTNPHSNRPLCRILRKRKGWSGAH